MSESKVISNVPLFTNLNDEEAVSIVGGLSWVQGYNGYVPPNAVSGGYADGFPQLYICRFYYQNGVHPGKLVGNNCNIGWGGKEVLSPNYEVLVA